MLRDDSPLPFPDTDPDTEHHAASPTAYLLDELALYGHRAGHDEPDPRPLPEAEAVQGHLGTISEALSLMESRHITALPVIDSDGTLTGVVHIHDLWRTNIF